MKKVKIMLLSLILIAILGAALSFKAIFQDSYCTTTPNESGQACPDVLSLDCTTTPIEPSIAIDPVSIPFYCFTTSDHVNPCDFQKCPGEAQFQQDLP